MKELLILVCICVALTAVVLKQHAHRVGRCEGFGGVLIGGGGYSKPTCVNPDGSIVMEYYK